MSDLGIDDTERTCRRCGALLPSGRAWSLCARCAVTLFNETPIETYMPKEAPMPKRNESIPAVKRARRPMNAEIAAYLRIERALDDVLPALNPGQVTRLADFIREKIRERTALAATIPDPPGKE